MSTMYQFINFDKITVDIGGGCRYRVYRSFLYYHFNSSVSKKLFQNKVLLNGTKYFTWNNNITLHVRSFNSFISSWTSQHIKLFKQLFWTIPRKPCEEHATTLFTSLHSCDNGTATWLRDNYFNHEKKLNVLLGLGAAMIKLLWYTLVTSSSKNEAKG